MPTGIYKHKKHTKKRKENISNALTGRKISEEHRQNTIKNAKRGKEHCRWEGDEVGYRGLHSWMQRNKIVPKPEFCEECKKRKPYDLANKGVYDRNPKNWEWLCRKCHLVKDGRLYNNLKQYKNKVGEIQRKLKEKIGKSIEGDEEIQLRFKDGTDNHLIAEAMINIQEGIIKEIDKIFKEEFGEKLIK